MRVAQQDYQTFTGGIAEQGQFTIEMNAFAFTSLINNLYANKIESPLRELVTNGIDGHAAAGCPDKPLQIHLPSHFDQTFWVRDFGCSMSHEFMMDGYLKLFSSTKRETDEQVGMLGLGRVSPLAYTDAYTVTTWLEGTERTYSVFLGAGGVPDCALLNARPSSEPTGVKISYPAKMEDVSRYRLAAQRVLFALPVQPEVVNETYEQPNVVEFARGSNWVVYDDFPLRPGFYARQGCVIYPVSSNFRRDHMPNLAAEYLRMVVDYPIGQLSVATSREELSYDTMTVENLKAGFEKAVEELTEKTRLEITGATTYWEACEMFHNMKGHYQSTQAAIRSLVAHNVSWNGLPLKEKFPLCNSSNFTPGMYFDDQDVRVGKHNWTLSFRKMVTDYTLTLSSMRNLKVFVEFDGLNFGTARMKRAMAELTTKGDRVLWLRLSDKTVYDAWAGERGNIPCIDLATIEPLKSPAAAKGATQGVKMRYFVPGASQNYAQYTSEVPTKDMLFVEQSEQCFDFKIPTRARQMVEKYTLESELAPLLSVGILKPGQRIYALNGTNKKAVIKALKTPIAAADFIQKAVDKKYKTDTLRIPQTTYETQKSYRMAERLVETGVPLWGSLLAFQQTYSTNTGQGTLTSDDLTVLRTWAPQCLVTSNEELHKKRRRTLFDEFDLLELIIDRSYGDTNERLTSYLKLLLNAKGN